MSDMMVRRPKPRTQSAGVPSEPSPSAVRGHVLPAAAGTDGPATHRLRFPDPIQQGVFPTWLKDKLKPCEAALEVITAPLNRFPRFARRPLVRRQVPHRPY